MGARGADGDLRALEFRQADRGGTIARGAGARGGRTVLIGAYVDNDGIVRLAARVEGLVDELAEPPVCTWCGVEVFQIWFGGGTVWAHRNTRLPVCSGQVTGGWAALREATPLGWRVAKRPGRARRKRSAAGVVGS